jgi:aryl-alcohol dehydrogenase-like predicted oxidoreductase
MTALKAQGKVRSFGVSTRSARARLRHVEQLRFLELAGQTVMTQAALRFPLAHPTVHCITRRRAPWVQLEANIAADDGDLTLEERARIAAPHETWRAQGD